MLRSMSLACCVLLGACLDFGAAYGRCHDAGRCDPVNGGGQGGSGGGATTGGGAGGGAATLPYDGGPPCTNSTRPRLRCDAPLTVASGGPFTTPGIGATTTGAIAAWSSVNHVFISELAFDGNTNLLLDELATANVLRVDLATEGDAWALVYLTSPGDPLICLSSLNDAGVPLGIASFEIAGAIAVTASRAVGVIGGGVASVDWATSDAGCPRYVSAFATKTEATWVNAVHVPGTGTEGFRFTGSSYLNTSKGHTSIYGPLPDGGLSDVSILHDLHAPYDHAAALNTSSTHAFLAYASTVDAADYDVDLRSLPVDGSPPDPATLKVGHDPDSLEISACGAGCMAVAWTQYEQPAHGTVFFATDDPAPAARGGVTSGWDFMCNIPTGQRKVAVAWAQGRLRLLVTQPSSVLLYNCDVPPP